MPQAAALRQRPHALLTNNTAVAVLLALCFLAVALGFLVMQWRALSGGAQQMAELHARVLEADSNATFNALAQSMRKTADVLLLTAGQQQPGAVLQAFEEPLSRYPALRSLSVLNESGQVLFSSEPGAVGLQLTLASLGTPTKRESVTIGKLLPIRGLADLAAPPGNPGQHSALTMLLRMPRSGAPPWLLVGLMNPDYLALQHAQLIGDHADRAAVLSFGGIVLQKGAQAAIERGSPALHLAPFRDFLPAREHGHYRGLGMDGQPAVGAFRTLRQWPLVVIVEHSHAEIKAQLQRAALWDGLVLVMAWSVIGIYTTRVNRSQARVVAARAQAQALNEHVALNEERWKLALEGAGEGVWDLDLASGALKASARAFAMLGLAPDALGASYRPWMALIHPQDRKPARTAVIKHLRERTLALRLEIRVRHRHGGWIWLLLRGATTGQRNADAPPRRLTGTLSDITEQRLIQEALQSSQARRDAILQSALDAIITLDANGRVVDFNPAAESMFGRTQAQVLGQPMHQQMLPPHLRGAHQAGMARYLASGQSRILGKRIETQAMRADGDLFPVELTVVPLNSGGESMFTATLRDISERLRTEAELRASEARAHETFEQAAVGVLHQALNQRYLRVNQTLCMLLGMARAEFLALTPAQLVHPDDLAQQAQGLAPLVAGETASVRAELRIRQQDGHYTWVRITSSLAQSASAVEPYIIHIVEDIHDRKLVEEQSALLLFSYGQAAAELERQRLALDKHTLVTMLGPTGLIVSANTKLCEVTGFTQQELIGQVHPIMSTSDSAFHEDNTADKLQALRDCITTGTVWQGELEHRHSIGSPIWAATTVVPQRDADGNLQQVFIIQTDITRRVIAERGASAARHMELNIGLRIQQSLLDTVLDQRLPRLWLGACMRPSQGIDGDFLHAMKVGEDCVDVITADVMGKGLGAALIGAAAKMQLVQCMAELMSTRKPGEHPAPAAVVAAMHKAMWPSLQSLDAFLTLSYVRIDSATDTITWVGCGQEEALLVYKDGGSLTLENQHPPIGVLEDVEYRQDSAPMHKGDALFCCSDGISDALLPNGDRVGRAVVSAAVKRLLGHCRAPSAILNALMREIIGPQVRAVDDTSLLLAVRTGDITRASRRELPFSMDGLAHVRGLVGVRCEQAGLEEAQAALFTVACVEAFTNIVRHATGRLADSKIELLVELEAGALRTEFVYLADAVTLPAISAPQLEEYPEGGYGLSIMQAASDDMRHGHQDGINTIMLAKQVS